MRQIIEVRFSHEMNKVALMFFLVILLLCDFTHQAKAAKKYATFGSSGERLIIERESGGDWYEITGQSRTVWVGERISLRARMSNDAEPTNRLWSIPGLVFSNYQPTYTSAHPTAVPSLTEKEIVFRWRDRGEYLVQFTGTVGKSTFIRGVNFQVRKPNATLTTARDNVRWLGNALRFGNIGVPGIAFHANKVGDWPSYCKVQWVQVVNGTSRRMTHVTAGSTWQRRVASVAGGEYPWLDTTYPYTLANEPDFGSPNADFATSDSPAQSPLWSDTDEIRITDSFTMWLMFKTNNSDSRWVPLRKVDWFWNGRAVLAGGAWTIASSDHGASNSEETTVFPQWEGNVSQGTWMPI